MEQSVRSIAQIRGPFSSGSMYTYLQALFSQIQHIDQSPILINFANGLLIILFLVILDKEPQNKLNGIVDAYRSDNDGI